MLCNTQGQNLYIGICLRGREEQYERTAILYHQQYTSKSGVLYKARLIYIKTQLAFMAYRRTKPEITAFGAYQNGVHSAYRYARCRLKAVTSRERRCSRSAHTAAGASGGQCPAPQTRTVMSGITVRLRAFRRTSA